MNQRVLLVPGTFDNRGDPAGPRWWKLGSSFWWMLRDLGFEPLSFAWSTRLDGVLGRNDAWEAAGANLLKQLLPGDRIIAFSHGGQVVAYALHSINAVVPRIHSVITLATPVRDDVHYVGIKVAAEAWTHVYGSNFDFWQILGAIGDRALHPFRRKMPLAANNIKVEGGHADTHSVETWERYRLGDLL